MYCLSCQDGRVNVSLKTGHALDAYGFGMFVSDILDTRTDLGNYLCFLRIDNIEKLQFYNVELRRGKCLFH